MGSVKVHRLGFSPLVEGLDEKIEGGVPEGSWVSIYGPPGGYKTLHAIAFCLAGLLKGERCIYVSTEMDVQQIKRQTESLGWRLSRAVHEAIFTSKIVEDKDYGSFEVVWLDLDGLRWWAWKLNSIVREEKEGSKHRVTFWYNDDRLLTHAILVSLGAVGVLERTVSTIGLDEVLYARAKDGLYDSKYAKFKVNPAVKARVVIDSISPFIIGKFSVAGRILTDMKIRLALPNATYIIVSHVSKMNEEELGANIGHIVDGRIKLWHDLDEKSAEAKHYGWIQKMRETEHSNKLHQVSVEKRGDAKVVRWQ